MLLFSFPKRQSRNWFSIFLLALVPSNFETSARQKRQHGVRVHPFQTRHAREKGVSTKTGITMKWLSRAANKGELREPIWKQN